MCQIIYSKKLLDKSVGSNSVDPDQNMAKEQFDQVSFFFFVKNHQIQELLIMN